MELLNEEQIKSMTSEEFIRFINHHLYQEVTVSLSFMELLLDDKNRQLYTQKQIYFLEMIRDSLKTMLKLVKIMAKWKPLQKV